MLPRFRSIPAAISGLVCSSLLAGAVLQPSRAPEWEISEWINGDPGKLEDHRDQVILIDFFQLWCPGCNSFSIPLFQRWDEMYGGRDDVLIVSIHTVFEGHQAQSPDRLRRFIEEKGIRHPVGIDSYASPEDDVPITMRRFETEGTPHVVIVDKRGRVQFSHFGSFEVAPVEAFIDRLLKEEAGGTKKKKRPQKAKRPGNRPAPRKDPAARAPLPPPQDRALSGKYDLWIEQSEKSCGPVLPRQEFNANVKVFDDRIEVFVGRQSFLGLRGLTVEYDAESRSFGTETEQTVRERGAERALGFLFRGAFLDKAEAPEVEFEFSLDKTSADGVWDCQVEGRGGGKRIAAR